jgi:exopolyphosphatase/guanosine-5'-triphosphate,3'-diphosphate pyrophosphatase
VTTLAVHLGATAATCEADGVRSHIPVGVRTLCDLLVSDPPLPEELINAIGWFQDHLEDVTREVPAAEFADRVELAGPAMSAVADVEVGGDATLPFELSRDAAEDVFRTLVTEAAAARAHNPGLAVTMTHTVLGAACAVVGLMRFLHLDTVWLVEAPEATS